MYDPSLRIGGAPSPEQLLDMQRQVDAHVPPGASDPAAARRWGLVAWALTVCVLLGVFGVLPSLVDASPGPVAQQVDGRLRNP